MHVCVCITLFPLPRKSVQVSFVFKCVTDTVSFVHYSNKFQTDLVNAYAQMLHINPMRNVRAKKKIVQKFDFILHNFFCRLAKRRLCAFYTIRLHWWCLNGAFSLHYVNYCALRLKKQFPTHWNSSSNVLLKGLNCIIWALFTFHLNIIWVS